MDDVVALLLRRTWLPCSTRTDRDCLPDRAEGLCEVFAEHGSEDVGMGVRFGFKEERGPLGNECPPPRERRAVFEGGS